MPAAFGAWYWMGGNRIPVHDSSLFQNEEEVRKYTRKYKSGKQVGSRELSEKFKALEIDDWDRWVRGIGYCEYCDWELKWFETCEEKEDDEHDPYMYEHGECSGGLCLWLVDGLSFGHTRGVYALNREAFAIHDAHRRKGRSSAPNMRRHRTSGQKRSALKKEARNALRDFDSRK